MVSSMYEPFYSLLLSDSVPGKTALRLFMSVECSKTNLKTIGKKRGYGTIKKRTDNQILRVEKIYDNICHELSSGRKDMNDLCHLAKMILLCEMRTDYMCDRWHGSGYSPAEYFKLNAPNHYWDYVIEMVQNGALYDPVVSLPKTTKNGGKQNIEAKESFPVFRFIDGMKDEISKINVDYYFR